MGAVQALLSNQSSPSSVQSYLTAAEVDLLSASDLTAFFDAKGWSVEASANGRIVTWYSRKSVGGLRPSAAAESEALGPRIGTVPGGTRTEIRMGIDAAGDPIVGSNNRTLIGSTDFTLPATPFTLAMQCRVLAPSNFTTLAGTQDSTDQLAWGVTSTGAMRVYANYSAVLLSSTAGDIDTGSHLLIFKHDGSTATFICDTTTIKTGALALPAYPTRAMRLGSIDNGGSLVSGAGYAIECFAVIANDDDETLDLLRAVLDERAP